MTKPALDLDEYADAETDQPAEKDISGDEEANPQSSDPDEGELRPESPYLRDPDSQREEEEAEALQLQGRRDSSR